MKQQTSQDEIKIKLEVEELEEVIAPGGGVPGYPRS